MKIWRKYFSTCKSLVTLPTTMIRAFLRNSSEWREECLLFIIKNYDLLQGHKNN